MSYKFRTKYPRDLHTALSDLVPISFTLDDGMPQCARMDFDDANQRVEIRYKSTADELVDIAHELLHVQMQFRDRFPLLAWANHHPELTPEIKDAVQRIRDAVDDTYVLHQLFADTGRLPVSVVFYREIDRDLKGGLMHILQTLPLLSRPMVTAWRLRLADLSCCAYGGSLTANQRELAVNFLAHFEGKDPIADDLFAYLKQNVTSAQLGIPHRLGIVLIALRDKLHLPSWLHLATRKNINGKWVLRK